MYSTGLVRQFWTRCAIHLTRERLPYKNFDKISSLSLSGPYTISPWQRSTCSCVRKCSWNPIGELWIPWILNRSSRKRGKYSWHRGYCSSICYCALLERARLSYCMLLVGWYSTCVQRQIVLFISFWLVVLLFVVFLVCVANAIYACEKDIQLEENDLGRECVVIQECKSR